MSHSELSPIELSFWYQYKFDPINDANNIVHRLIIAKSLDEHAIKTALNQVIGKHKILSSGFDQENGTPFRITREQASFDLINGGDMTTESVLKTARRPFILEDDNLLRVVFLQHKANTTLFVTCPHIVFDAVSWNIFLKDLVAAINDDLVKDDYLVKYQAVDQRAQQYWQDKLQAIDGRVPFELRAAQSTRDGNLGLIEIKDSATIFKRLVDLGQAESTSMSSLCIAILAVTLGKLTDSQKFIISTPVTTRDSSSLDSIGSYINVLPIIANPNKNDAFADYVKELSSQIWEGIDNRNFSLIELLAALRSGRHDDTQGIYNTMAEYVPSSPLDDLLLEDSPIPNRYTKLDLTLSVMANNGDPKLVVEYDRTKLEADYVSKIIDTFMVVADSVIKRPSQLIEQIPMVDETTKKSLLGIGAGPTKAIEPPFVWNRFKSIAKKYPNLVAINEKDRTITYQELLDTALRYAGYLHDKGVTKGTAVGIHLERSADFIASMFAIWSLGAIYVPLDTKQPASRLEFMIKQAWITTVITKGKHNLKADFTPCDLNDSQSAKLRDSDYEPQPGDIAYIIFTSGSTGTPKGVMIEHQGFLNHLEIMINDPGISQKDVIAQTAPVSFDISVWQLICAFMVGASVVMIDHDELIDPERIYKIIQDKKVSILEVVPSLISAYLLSEDSSSNLRGALAGVSVIATGEAISGSVVKHWTTHYPDQVLLNAYGPAEASDDTHFFDISAKTVDFELPIPIGRPLLNIQTYVVNQGLQLCPKGVVGEICIGGVAVAKGYVGDKDLTEKSFIPNPFAGPDGERLYRTGDYGRWRNDNLLEYHGRRDHQVKVRGQRLELGEVENKLKELTGIKDAAVIAEKAPGGTRLMGYVVLDSPEISLSDLKAELQKKLPDYMIPWKLESLPDLPRNNNGKLDRRALEERTPTSERTITPAAGNSGLVDVIISTYSQIMQTPVNADSNYFDCGGDSIQSMKIVALLEKTGIRVGIRDILAHQTPRELALFIDNSKPGSSENWQALKGPTPIQNHYLANTGKDYINNGEIQAAIVTVSSKAKLSNQNLLAALQQVMNIHDELRLKKESVAFVMDTPAAIAKTEVLIDKIRDKISLDKPLAGYLLPGNKILLVAHHLALDFYSWDILRDELNEILCGRALAIPAENSLKQWWGRALSDLTSSEDIQKLAKKTWTVSNAGQKYKKSNSGTVSLTYKHELPATLTKNLQRSGVSIENLTYYLLAHAYTKLAGAKTFLCNIESSLRSTDNTGLLHKAVGWMTYIFPASIDALAIDKTSLVNFHTANTQKFRTGYQYGLLRYDVCPDIFSDQVQSPWTVNYVGKNVNNSPYTEVLKALPQKSAAFLEVDISYDDTSLIFEFIHNTDLDKSYFDLLNGHLQKGIEQAVSELGVNAQTISDSRKQAILQRLNRAK